MRFSVLSVLTVLLTSGIHNEATANITYFLPGDAFFCARLTKEGIDRLEKEKSPTFLYFNGWDSGGLGCGSAGYERLKIPEFPLAMQKHLKAVFKDLGSSLDNDSKGRKVLYVFFYNRKYDWKKHSVGIQYNEKWVEETVQFGHKKTLVRLESFVGGDALIAAWRDSPSITPLKTEIPKNANGTPVVLNGDFQLLIIPTRPKSSCNDYFSRKDGVRIIEITKNDRKDYVAKDYRWIAKPGS